MFRKYHSIENAYQSDFIEKIKAEGFDRQTFAVQEKAHGANLSFWTANGQDFHYGKRTGALDWDEKFYNFQYVFDKNQEKLMTLYKEVVHQFDGVVSMHVFGELIGGSYKHPDVSKDPQAIMTQKGIFYSPSNEFYAFDLMINQATYLDVKVTNELFEKTGFLYAKNLFEGSFVDCLAFPNTFESTIYQQLQLPPIVPNIAEGVVIKPLKACFLNNGKRVIVKNKNEKWEEVAHRKKRVKKAAVKKSEQVKFLEEEIQHYITENRWNNLLSKIGSFEKKDFGKVLGLFSKDIVEDFEKDFAKEMNELEKNEQKLVKKAIGKPAKLLINQYLNQ